MRTASVKGTMIFLAAGLMISLLISIVLQYSETTAGGGKNTTDTACTVLDIHTETSARSWKSFTVLSDDSGNLYKLRTTFKDHIGRKTVISTAGSKAYRKNFELVRPVGPGWAIYLLPLLFAVCLVWYPVKVKLRDRDLPA